MSLFEELKRRKVVRTTIAYLAAAFVAAQALQLIAEALSLPSWILKSFVLLLIVALPLVIGLAWAFDITPEGVEHTSTAKVTIQWKRVALPGFVSATLLFVIVGFYVLNKSEMVLNNSLVAVLPFQVSGDPQIAYLENGMVDLLAAKLTGEGGPRAADPRAVLSAIRKAGSDIDPAKAKEIARSIGAGQLLTGSIVGTAKSFTINAQLTRTTGSQISAEVTTSVDSMLPAIDRLVGKLLSLQAGEGQRLEQLTTTSLDALRAYLEAQGQYRSGHFGLASTLYAHAVDVDSTFALAALGQILSGSWGEGPPTDVGKIRRALLNNLDHLGPVDRAIAIAITGGQNHNPRTYRERLGEREAIVNQAPDRVDAWFIYADLVTHWGAVADLDQAAVADRAFNRILQLDSSYVPALLHLMDNAWLRGDEKEYRRLDAIRRVRDPNSTAAIYQRSWRAHILGDSAVLKADRAALDTLSNERLSQMAWIGGASPGATRDGVAALDKLLAHTATSAERSNALGDAATIFMAYGMPARAAAAAEEEAQIEPDPSGIYMREILNALYENGDTIAAARAIQKLHNLNPPLAKRMAAECAVAQWDLWRGNTSGSAKIALDAAAVPRDSLFVKNEAEICLRTLAVIRSIQGNTPDLKARVKLLDDVMQGGPPMRPVLRNAANIVLSRGAERSGDLALAYKAMRRIPYHPVGWELSSTMHRESARLAALNGDRDYAIREYKRYLDSHEMAEPALKQTDDAVRAHLAQLTGERRN